MKWVLPAVVLLASAGCLDDAADAIDDAFDSAIGASACLFSGDEDAVFYFGPAHTLSLEAPAGAGSEGGNAFSSAFLTNDLKEWLSAPVEDGFVMTGTVILEYWAQSTGSPAPLMVGGDTGEGYHFFNQLGSDVAVAPSYVVEYAEAAMAPGTIRHYVHEFEMPEGGFVVESGDSLRVLLTSLATDGPDGGGHIIHYGGEMPSQVRFDADCYAKRDWIEAAAPVVEAVSLPFNQGLLTGAVPAEEGVNAALVPFDLAEATDRLTVKILADAGNPNPTKDDIDITITDVDGNPVWGGSTPYTDETLRAWRANFDATMPPGRYHVEVASYSGIGYSGQVEIVQEERD